MTTIVGVRQDRHNSTVIGTDTRISQDNKILGRITKTVLVAPGTESETCVAISGAVGCIFAIQDLLSADRSDLSFKSTSEVFRSVVQMHRELKENYGLLTDNDDGMPFEDLQCQLMIGNSYGLWAVLNTREVIPVPQFYALGSGREFAMGACSVLGVANPEKTVRRAIHVASTYDSATNNDVEIWHINTQQGQTDA